MLFYSITGVLLEFFVFIVNQSMSQMLVVQIFELEDAFFLFQNNVLVHTWPYC